MLRFGPLVESGLSVLEQYEPEYAKLIRNGTVRLEEAKGGITAPGGGGISLPDKIIIVPDPTHPGSTAVALYEEIYHLFQPGGHEQVIELEAKAAVAEWVIKNNIPVNTVGSGDIEAYKKGGLQGLQQWLQANYANNLKAPGKFYGKMPNPVPKPPGT
jgi:hypothetical protein